VSQPFSQAKYLLTIIDSITLGQSSEAVAMMQGGYRGPLVDLLDGNFVNMVGEGADGMIRDLNHEGWVGFIISDIHKRFLVGSAANPNIVLLHAGTNDIKINGPNVVSWAAGNLSSLIDTIHQTLPQSLIIVAQIGPANNAALGSAAGDVEGRMRQYNKLVASMVASRASNSFHIALANVHDALTLADISDTVHPDKAGYVKVAKVWYNVINEINTKHPDWIKPVAVGTLNYTSGKLVCPVTSDYSYSFTNSLQVMKLAGRPNLYPGVQCSDFDNMNLCRCIDQSGSFTGQAYTVRKVKSCAEMSSAHVPAVHFADINGDGRADYIYLGASGQLSSWLSTGGEWETVRCGEYSNDKSALVTVQAQGQSFGGFGNQFSRADVRLADIDGDGRADYILVTPEGLVTVWQNQVVYSTSSLQPGPQFISEGAIYIPITDSARFPGAGIRFADLDADGRADMIYVALDGSIVALRNNGPIGKQLASFGSAQVVYQPSASRGLHRDNILLADMNGDGRADLVLLNRTTGAFSFFLNTGPRRGSFASFNATARWVHTAAPPVDASGVQFADLGATGRGSIVNIDNNTSGFTVTNNYCAGPCAGGISPIWPFPTGT
jgi:lysophospholipase L1-like esterase